MTAKTSESARDFAIYGLRVRSDLDLPGWPSLDNTASPEITILRAPLPGPTIEGPNYSAKALTDNGELRLAIGGVARYSATGGDLILVDPDSNAKPEDVQLYLTGVVLTAILHQRGIIPLHASCIALNGQGIAVAGPSGAGKSTLVVALLRRGASFVSDDICVLAPLANGSFGVWPTMTRTKLDPAALGAMESTHEDLEPAGGNRGKFLLPVGSLEAGAKPVPLRRVYLLRDEEGEPRAELLEGMEAVSALVEETYYFRHAVAFGLATKCFGQAAALARKVQVARLLRPRGFQHLQSVVELIEAENRRA